MNSQKRGQHPCLLCSSEALFRVAQSADLQGVTSDCKPWPRSGSIFVCEHCGHVQKRTDADWRCDAAEIYADYDVYHLSGGAEQVVFQGPSPAARSVWLLERLRQHVAIPERGYLLDVGCGNGTLLRSFGRSYPQWVLAGAEQNDRFREEVERIPGIENFYSGPLDGVDHMFNLITLLHVLEHVPKPVRLLKQLHRKLAPNGLMLAQVPNLLENAIDLVVADHCSHFVPETLVALAERTGFEAVAMATNWVPKEISLVLRAAASRHSNRSTQKNAGELFTVTQNGVAWLERVVSHAREVASGCNFGMFGTAIAGTWLAGVLGAVVRFFVDEDPLRAGKTHLGRQVLQPADAPNGSCVYLALPPLLAREVHERLQLSHPRLKFVVPPDMCFSKLA